MIIAHFPILEIKGGEGDSSSHTISWNLFYNLLCVFVAYCMFDFGFKNYPFFEVINVTELLCIWNDCVLFCRYHYNVSDTRLSQHIEKGNEDGLYISGVASCQNLWALIMDAGTGFTAQVYELSPFFLHKVNFNPLLLFFYLCIV